MTKSSDDDTRRDNKGRRFRELSAPQNGSEKVPRMKIIPSIFVACGIRLDKTMKPVQIGRIADGWREKERNRDVTSWRFGCIATSRASLPRACLIKKVANHM
jgi:hypothetical protein